MILTKEDLKRMDKQFPRLASIHKESESGKENLNLSPRELKKLEKALGPTAVEIKKNKRCKYKLKNLFISPRRILNRYNYFFLVISSSPSNPVVKILNKLPMIDENMVLKIIFLYAVTVLVSTVSWFLIEKPINKWKDKFSY